MNEMVVHTKEQLAAAFMAGACETHAGARAEPFVVTFGTCTYTFRHGLHAARAALLAKAARSLRHGARAK